MRTGMSMMIGLILLTTIVSCAPASASRATLETDATLAILGTADEEYVRGMVRAFESETGIQTMYERKSAGEALDLLRGQREAPHFSVWWGGSADGYIAAREANLLEPYKPRGFGKIPRQYKDENGAWTGVYVGALALAVNTRVLAERGLPEPTRWADLTDPAYRGQISMAHPATSGTAYTALSTIVQLNGRDVERSFAYLAALNRNISSYERAGSAAAWITGRGETAIGIAFAHDVVAAMEDGWTDLKVVFPAEGTGYEIGGMALLKNAPAPELGQRFMDWALSDSAQELGPLFTAYQIPTNPDAKVPAKSVRLSAVKTIDYDFSWAGDRRQALVDRFSATIARPPSETQVSPGSRTRQPATPGRLEAWTAAATRGR